jgi:TetR/AcrR family transcriptional regulator, regulator of cefoperazone and chloramphenicol sensitivity
MWEKPPMPAHATSQQPQRRGDGAATRAVLLEAAGQVIAEKGIDRATGKEIAQRAGTNSAAINYYFGGMEGLHAEVLVEAHRSLATIDDLAAVADGDAPPEAKLRRFMEIAVEAAKQPRSRSWALRVLSREFFAPSAASRVLEDAELIPKKALIHRIVAEVMGRPADDPAVERCAFSVIAPIMMMLVCTPNVRDEGFPWSGPGADPAAVAAHLYVVALAGIQAVGKAG